MIIIIQANCFAANKFSFVVFGDNRNGDKTFIDLIAKVNAEAGIAFAVNTGDFVSRGQYKEYLKYQKLIKNLKIKLYNTMGNHDAVFGGWKNYHKFYGRAFYSFNYQNSHFIVLDNSFDRRLTKYQFNWLKNDLAETKKENIFVFLHRPLFDPVGIFAGHIMESKVKADKLCKLFEKYGVAMVFAGHIHGFAEGTRSGIRYVIAAGAGAPLYLPEFMGGFYHYVKVNVEDREITYQVKRVYE